MIDTPVIKRSILFSFVRATTVVVVIMVAASSGAAWAAGDATCSGGSIAAGVYSNLNIAGACAVDKGSVTVQHNLTVLPGATLVAVTGGIDGFGDGSLSSDLTVGGNLDVQAGAVLVLGCEPVYNTCPNDPTAPPFPGVGGTYLTQHTVSGNLTAENALTVVIHRTTVFGNITLTGGGGGVSCSSVVPGLFFPPYGDLEDVTAGGNVTITGWQSCWLGMFRVTANNNVTLSGNTTADPDGNEIAHNTVLGNLSCSGNVPANQAGDSAGGKNIVRGNASGQCSGLVK
jgi:hypothetical protein